MNCKEYTQKKYFEKGSLIMFLFVVENAYEINQIVQQINVQGLNVVCEYFGYEEK